VNDGLVSLRSAEWRELIEAVEVDHFDIVFSRLYPTLFFKFLASKDTKLSRVNLYNLSCSLLQTADPKFTSDDFYLRMATFLNHKGF